PHAYHIVFSHAPAPTEIYTLSLHDALPIFFAHFPLEPQAFAQNLCRREQDVFQLIGEERRGVSGACAEDEDQCAARLPLLPLQEQECGTAPGWKRAPQQVT